MPCSIAQTLDIIGEFWTLLILRDLFLGNRRFSRLEANLGISKKVLSDRLKTLLAAEIIQQKSTKQSGGWLEYHLTEKGEALGPVLLALMAWGDHWVFNDKVPIQIIHKNCNHPTKPGENCSHCGEPINFNSVSGIPSAGMNKKEAAQWKSFRESIDK